MSIVSCELSTFRLPLNYKNYRLTLACICVILHLMENRIRTVPSTPEQIAHNLEMARRQEWRDKYLVPIYVMWTSNVPDDLSQAAVLGANDTLCASGQQREVLIFGSNPFVPADTAFASPDWYIQEAQRRQYLKRDVGFGPQIATEEVIRLFVEEPYQQSPHWEVFIVNHDLNARAGSNGEYINFVFGSTDSQFPASVQSVTRPMAEVRNQELKRAMIRRLLRHEVGHMFGLPARTTNVEGKLGGHCTSPICTMKQGMSIPEWAKRTQDEVSTNIQFCNDCLADLTRIRPRFQPLPQSSTT